MAPKKRKLAAGGGLTVAEEKTATKTKKSRKANSAADEQADRRVTRGMARRDAIQAVFNTAELLENIFLFLPLKDVFVSMRVSRQFRDIVTTSTPIHRALFLLSTNQNSRKWTLRRYTPAPFMAFAHVLFAFEYIRSGNNRGEPGKTWDHTVTSLNPLLRLGPTKTSSHSPTLTPATSPHENLTISFMQPIVISHEFSSLWTDMHIMRPPIVRGVSITFRWELTEDSTWSGTNTIWVSNREGLTFGDVLSGLQNTKIALRPLGFCTRNGNMRYGTLVFMAKQLKKSRSGTVIIKDINLSIPDVVVPSDKQLAQMESTGRAEANRRG